MSTSHAVEILLIEDTPGDAERVRKGLERVGRGRFHLTMTSRLRQALAEVRQSHFAAALLDLHLPDSQGLETLNRLQAEAPDLPIVVLTGYDESLALEAMRGGAQDYLCKKNLTPEVLNRALVHAMERTRLSRDPNPGNDRYALAGRSTNDGLWDWDLQTDRIFFSSRWKSILGYADDAVGDHVEEWFRRVHGADLEHLKAAIKLHLAGATDHLEAEYRMRDQNGVYRWMLCRGLAVRNPEGKPCRMVGSHNDITRLKLAEMSLVHDARHDTLTRLYNRQFFHDCLKRVLERSTHHKGYKFAVLFLDLDGFKLVNDSLGHGMGDQLLVSVAQRLRECVRPTDFVARLGGDEFTLLLDDLQEYSEAMLVAERVRQALTAPVILDGHTITVGTSIGIATSAVTYTRAEDLLRDADTALYRAKAAGKGRAAVFDSAMHQEAVARLNMEMDLRQALKGNTDLEVHYQPIVALSTGRVAGLEVLARWHHPVRGWISPEEFIPVAEESHLISPLGRYVLERAFADALGWRHLMGKRPLPALSVNLSVKQLTSETVDVVRAIIERARATDGPALSLEVTESISLERGGAAPQVLQALRDLGVRLCIDDFGTGYSSLRYLRASPFEVIKIDRSFVSDMRPSGEGTNLVRTIVDLGQSLGLATVAEGVETVDQLEMLRAMGCDYAQGFLLSRPLEREAVPAALEAAPHVFRDNPKTRPAHSWPHCPKVP